MLKLNKTIMVGALLLSLTAGQVSYAGNSCKQMPTVEELMIQMRMTRPGVNEIPDIDPNTLKDPFEDLMKAVATDVGGETSGVLAGWVLNAFLGQQPNQDIEKIKDALKKQQQMLSDIQKQITGLSDQMKQETQAIMDEDERNHYEDLVSTLNQPISYILAYYEQLNWLTQEDPSCDHKAEVAEVRDNIITNVLPTMIQINMVLAGQGGSGTVTPAISYWRDLVLKKTPGYGTDFPSYPRFVSNLYLKPMNMFMDYYKRIQGVATLLVMEALHAQNSPDIQMAQHYLDLYNTNVATQQDQAQILCGNLPDDNLVIDTQNKVMWMYKPVLKNWDISHDYRIFRSDLNNFVANFNAQGYAGYKDWRLLSQQDAQNMFGGLTPGHEADIFANNFGFWWNYPPMFESFVSDSNNCVYRVSQKDSPGLYCEVTAAYSTPVMVRTWNPN